MAAGIVYLVGAGPGDPGLITVRGLACIRRADLIVYDRLASPALVACSRPDAEKIYAGKEPGRHGRTQAEISRLLADRALAGQVVCRLKGGDPFIFGRGGEEAAVLAECGVPFEVVPGITAGIAAPAYAGIPVTHRDLSGSVALITGHDAPGKGGPAVDWAGLARGAETLLIYMGALALSRVTARLIDLGRAPSTPAAVISRGTQAEQRTVTATLAEIADLAAEAGLTSPAMIVVGDVAALREQLAWVEARPLFGRRVLIPTAGETIDAVGTAVAAEMARWRDLGAEVWPWPVAAPGPGGEQGGTGTGLTPRMDLAPLLRQVLAEGAVHEIAVTDPALVPHLLAVAGGLAALDNVRMHGATDLAGIQP
jgi:uroporphyrinogen III methyltransferase/synthase